MSIRKIRLPEIVKPLMKLKSCVIVYTNTGTYPKARTFLVCGTLNTNGRELFMNSKGISLWHIYVYRL